MSATAPDRWVRDTYKVPAYVDGRVKVDGRKGTIYAFVDGYLMVQFDDGPTGLDACHPTWRVEYLDAP